MVGLEEQVGEFKRSLAPLQATLESTTDGILVSDNDGIVTGVNAKHAVRVITLTMFDEADRANATREAGAKLYVDKSGPVEAVLGAIHGTRAAP